ncbi:AbrB/MazE/SpoVT family DNA-binding domain-containing protein (plasmid) [Rossellomorea sp. FS2]|uniref:AbrB/MazE/SpoVT family DNA-binding domain-containing protein n=1 Tax=Rossellomorea sp. FS2 TaxID=3391447 RepID=UPI003A4DB671
MRSTGIVRKVDELGRIVVPKEIRRVLGIQEKDPMEIFVEDDIITLQKYKPEAACDVTGEISPRNQTYGYGQITLSPEGARALLEELKEIVG